MFSTEEVINKILAKRRAREATERRLAEEADRAEQERQEQMLVDALNGDNPAPVQRPTSPLNPLRLKPSQSLAKNSKKNQPPLRILLLEENLRQAIIKTQIKIREEQLRQQQAAFLAAQQRQLAQANQNARVATPAPAPTSAKEPSDRRPPPKRRSSVMYRDSETQLECARQLAEHAAKTQGAEPAAKNLKDNEGNAIPISPADTQTPTSAKFSAF
jgi:hypothetical protein